MRESRFQRGWLGILSLGMIVFLSGASTLTYEIVWQREMFHIFGASAPATTAILSAIFLGIAFGSLMCRGIVGRVRRPYLLLAALEGVIGLWGIVIPTVMSIAEGLYIDMAHRLGEGSTLLSGARFVLAIIPLLPSTLCMGATIPAMVRAVGDGKSASVAWIYGLNILGAVAGALTTGLLWIRILGQSESAWVAIALNAVVVILALLLARTAKTVSAEQSEPEAAFACDEPLRSYPFLKSMYFAAGFVALGLEVVWLRYLGIVNSNSSVTFSFTLAFYLFGMGTGSLLVYRPLRRYLKPYTIFAVANGGVAVLSLATYPVILSASSFNRTGIEIPAAEGTLTLGGLYQTEASIIFMLLFLPAVFMGMIYPAVCDSVTGGERGRRDWIASSYFLGTLGSVAGTLVISLAIIPAVGLHATFSALVAISAALCSLAAIFGHLGRVRNVALGIMALTLIAAVLIAVERRPVLRNTVANREHGRWMEVAFGSNEKPSTEIVRFRAGASGTVITKRDTRSNDHLLYVDDQLVASTNLAAKVDALMLAHLPLLLHPEPKNELTVGFGTGGTSHAITTHGISAFCVEIEPEVPRSAHLLTDQNYGVLENPLFELIINDARDHLKITQRRYDVIATDVTNLQYKQNSSLYTVEYFQLMKQRLQSDGVACAWVPMAAIANEELRILMKSFQTVFPHATLWFMNHTHTNFGILIGTPNRLQIDYARLEDGFSNRTVADSLAEIGLTHPMQLVHCLHLDEDGYRSFCGDVPVHTDNNPTLEFSSPLSFYQYYETFCENLSAELDHRPNRFQQYVVNGPSPDAEVWKQHQVAADAGCRVILSMYQFQTRWTRGQTESALQALNDAIETARSGMAAWPQDTAREEFYSNFFDKAQRQVQSRMR